MENTARKNSTTLYSYFPAPLFVEGYSAILDQDPSVLSVLQAPVDGNNDSVIKKVFFFWWWWCACMYVDTCVKCEHFFSPCSVEGELQGLSKKPALNSLWQGPFLHGEDPFF